ncbi:hypothetical protein CAEBREN_18206 [Caenorhabditis brenneri]|uniref:Uncharacterized protein n=1 Tax=Caenorhabditis brenneri TaxID=135651 RepID=G0MH84_CAEBE|nr:hypothetical protein CAEBREN_18206 [Caenorhabditis brenneri]
MVDNEISEVRRSEEGQSREELLSEIQQAFIRGADLYFERRIREIAEERRIRVAAIREQVKNNVSKQKKRWASSQSEAEKIRRKERRNRKKARKTLKMDMKRLKKRNWIPFREFKDAFAIHSQIQSYSGPELDGARDDGPILPVYEFSSNAKNKKKKKHHKGYGHGNIEKRSRTN